MSDLTGQKVPSWEGTSNRQGESLIAESSIVWQEAILIRTDGLVSGYQGLPVWRATSPEEKDLKRSDAHPDQSKGRRPSKKSKDHDEDGRRIDYGSIEAVAYHVEKRPSARDERMYEERMPVKETKREQPTVQYKGVEPSQTTPTMRITEPRYIRQGAALVPRLPPSEGHAYDDINANLAYTVVDTDYQQIRNSNYWQQVPFQTAEHPFLSNNPSQDFVAEHGIPLAATRPIVEELANLLHVHSTVFWKRMGKTVVQCDGLLLSALFQRLSREHRARYDRIDQHLRANLIPGEKGQSLDMLIQVGDAYTCAWTLYNLYYSRPAEGVPDLVVDECHPKIVGLYRKLEGELCGAQLSWA